MDKSIPNSAPKGTFVAAQKVVLRGKAARRFAQGQSRAAASDWIENIPGADENETALNNGLYAAEDGRTVLRTIKTEGRGENKITTEEYLPICDLVATVSKEYRNENGDSVFWIEGRTRAGRRFQVEIEASKITDAKSMAALLSNVAGAGCVFYASQDKHLGPSISSFSPPDEIETWRRFVRTGWTKDGDEFIIPGLEAPDMIVSLPPKLCYQVAPPTRDELQRGLEALEALIKAQREEMTLVCLCSMLAAPFAVNADWRGERHALFITGRTGSFKTTWATGAMCLYGPKFANEDNILKFGPGATNNSRMKFFTEAGDLVLLVDNYKPGTGKGEGELVELIHLVMEGGEKERLNRSSEHRETSPIHAWPMFTGEDTIHDAAGAARCLIVPFPPAGEDTSAMTRAQNGAPDLHFVGGAWIEWCKTPEAKAVGAKIQKLFPEKRAKWAAHLRSIRPDMANIFRVASNLAVNELAFGALLSCPMLAPIFREYKKQHAAGLLEIASSMGQHTAQALECNRYLDAIRALLSSNQAFLCPRNTAPASDERRLSLGWEDDKGVYLIPEIAYSQASRLLRDTNGLNAVSKGTIHKQLDQLGHLERRGKDEYTVRMRCGYESKVVSVLHLKTEIIYPSQTDDEKTQGDLGL